MKNLSAVCFTLSVIKGIKLNSDFSIETDSLEVTDESAAKQALAQAEKSIATVPEPQDQEAEESANETQSLSEVSSEKADEKQVEAVDGYKPVKSILEKSSPKSLIHDLVVRSDGLSHLLLSDMDVLLHSIERDFPEYTKVHTIGKSTEGRDIKMIEIASGMKELPKESNLVELLGDTVTSAAEVSSQVMGGEKPAILITGATHAREMISTSLATYQMLKLLQQGAVKHDPKYEKMLEQNRYYFMPIFNVDGVAEIEDHWKKEGKIIPRRKNLAQTEAKCEDLLIERGVDLNRNFGIAFGEIDDAMKDSQESWVETHGEPTNTDGKAPMWLTSNPCSTNFPGKEAFSEPETQAYRDFLTSHKNELAFVINMHSNGNAFIYPFNGVAENDIEKRRPGVMDIFQKIKKDAPFPPGEQFGNSKEVMGLTLGGDQDDWTLGQLGIPSVTAEVGNVIQFKDEWQIAQESFAQDIVEEQSPWVEYIYEHLPEFGATVFKHQSD